MLCLEPLFSRYTRIADWEVAQTIKHQGVLIQKTLDFMDVRFGTMDRRSRPWTGALTRYSG
jgi:hypothetical protein